MTLGTELSAEQLKSARSFFFRFNSYQDQAKAITPKETDPVKLIESSLLDFYSAEDISKIDF